MIMFIIRPRSVPDFFTNTKICFKQNLVDKLYFTILQNTDCTFNKELDNFSEKKVKSETNICFLS